MHSYKVGEEAPLNHTVQSLQNAAPREECQVAKKEEYFVFDLLCTFWPPTGWYLTDKNSADGSGAESEKLYWN